MPDWLLPAILALGGGTGLGSFLTAIFNARGAGYAQLNILVDQLQEDRTADRLALTSYAAKVDTVLALLQNEREYAAALLVWGLNGAPPPPPQRRTNDVT